MPDEPRSQSRPVWQLAVGISLVLHLTLGIHTAVRKTVTHDELWHLPVGILNWQTAEFHHDDLNPPLTRMWAALPAWLFGPDIETGQDATDIGTRFVEHHDNYHTWYVLGRIMNLLLSSATIVLAAIWARDWFGPGAGALTAVLLGTEPNLLAHSSLVTPDAGLMLGFTGTLLLTARWRDQPDWKTTLWLGIALGLAQTTKFTAVLLYGIVIPIGLLNLLWPRSTGVSRGMVAIRLLTLIGISLVVWNSVFLFQGSGRPLNSYQFHSQAMQSIQQTVLQFGNLPVPWPEDYLSGIDRQRSIMEQQHPVFLDGEWNVTGFRSYFLRTLQYKLSHTFQLLLLVGACLLLRRRAHRRSDLLLLAVGPVIVLTVIASWSSMQLGVRYVLPLLPLLVLCVGPVAAGLSSRFVGWRRITGILILAGVLWPLRHHPHHLASFNELAGGPVGGRQHLLDSNLDWGQDLHLVKKWMDEHDIDNIGLVYFGTLPPAVADISWHIPRSRLAEPGWHAVSVNFVMGRPHQIRQPDGQHRAVDFNEFGYFRRLEPVVTLGGSIDIYHIP